MIDLVGRTRTVRGYSPQAATTDNTPLVSQIVDLQGTNGAMVVIATGSLADADATFDVKVEHGDNSGLSDAANVPLGQLVGKNSAGVAISANPSVSHFLFSDDDKVFKIGYIGSKRYIRVTITPNNNTGNAFISMTVHMGGLISNTLA